jgi:hypothetical protein
MRLKILIPAILGLAGFTYGQILAQNVPVAAKAAIDTTIIELGGQTGFRVEVSHPAGARIAWGIRGDTLSRKVEIVNRQAIDSTTSADGRVVLTQLLTITSFDTGYIVIPPLQFAYLLPGDSLPGLAETEPLLLYVQVPAVDLAQDIRDIKSLRRVKFSFREILPYLGWFVLAWVAAFLVYYYIQYRRGKRPYFLIPPRPKLPPHEEALAALEKLRLKQLWQQGHFKAYHSELTDILRNYLQGRMGIPAPEMVSDEIIETLRNSGTDRHLTESTERVLRLADLVKFARFEPLPDENNHSFDTCLQFINATKPVDESKDAANGLGPVAHEPKKS